MAYIYRKTVGGKDYYYLRASVRKQNKVLAKDILYLGDDINSIRDKIKDIPHKYSEQIKKTYKTINKFIEFNLYLEKVRALKLKKDPFLAKESQESIESCKLHWTQAFSKQDELTGEEILKNFIVEFAFNTTSIEGNTISLDQAQKLLVDNLTPKNKSLREIYDLQNTEKVFMKLFLDRKKDISHDLICQIHDSLLENIDSRKGYRTQDVRVFKAHFKSTSWPYVKTDMNILLKWFKENKGKLHPFVLAVMFHHKIEKIHPFMDGNGRTGRILMNYILLQQDYPPIIITKKNRTKYLDNLHKADECPINKANDLYTDLIEFSSSEYSDNYWNIFL
ncbi:TPA: Fic family protein [Candidatus Woesearchaeota archaeon]|nr:Fic family protein [Candidatus Woesearchaeota archaeon]HIH32587.1 Fic family protein [Candidatus Woesearchaeota archaeon]HIH54751.1 Fic family protein [Candidatus Woesearchaeota archaeon]HIJ02095.1 Fic family protein [Candidatus Woesearchaeota archaeon]HIJ14706.1 Fic family protein [Candidatus Woesearchaeota archaeon]